MRYYSVTVRRDGETIALDEASGNTERAARAAAEALAASYQRDYPTSDGYTVSVRLVSGPVSR